MEIGNFIASLFIVGRWIVLPAGAAVVLLAQGLSLKRYRTRLGSKITSLPGLRKRGTFARMFPVFMIAIYLATAITATTIEPWSAAGAGALALLVFSFQMHTRRFEKLRGVYEHGVCLSSTPLLWKDVHSFQRTSGGLGLLTHQGARFDLLLRDHVESVANRLIEHGVEER